MLSVFGTVDRLTTEEHLSVYFFGCCCFVQIVASPKLNTQFTLLFWTCHPLPLVSRSFLMAKMMTTCTNTLHISCVLQSAFMWERDECEGTSSAQREHCQNYVLCHLWNYDMYPFKHNLDNTYTFYQKISMLLGKQKKTKKPKKLELVLLIIFWYSFIYRLSTDSRTSGSFQKIWFFFFLKKIDVEELQ